MTTIKTMETTDLKHSLDFCSQMLVARNQELETLKSENKALSDEVERLRELTDKQAESINYYLEASEEMMILDRANEARVKESDKRKDDLLEALIVEHEYLKEKYQDQSEELKELKEASEGVDSLLDQLKRLERNNDILLELAENS
jgi:recombination DNA repair RAD52 pathway protein